MVNNSARKPQATSGSDERIYKALILFIYFYARSMGNLVKNSVILEVGAPANSSIHIPVHSVVDVSAGPLCGPGYA